MVIVPQLLNVAEVKGPLFEYEKCDEPITLPRTGLLWPRLYHRLDLYKQNNGGGLFNALRWYARYGSLILPENFVNLPYEHIGKHRLDGEESRREQRLNTFIENHYRETRERLTRQQATDKLIDAGLKLAESCGGLPEAFDEVDVESDRRRA